MALATAARALQLLDAGEPDRARQTLAALFEPVTETDAPG
jgi:hypothetical protein